MFLSLLHINVGGDPDSPCPGQKWLGNLYRIHQRLWMAFPDETRLIQDPFFLGPWEGSTGSTPKPKRRDAGFLFRVERDGSPRILVQSVGRPNWEYAFQNAPYLLASRPRIREFEPRPRQNERYRFRLLASVARRESVAHAQGKRRKTRPELLVRQRKERLVRLGPVPESLPDDLTERARILRARWDPWRDWLRDMGHKNGFDIIDEARWPLHMEAVYSRILKPGKHVHDPGRKTSIDKRFNGGLFEGVLICTSETLLREALLNGVGPQKAFGFGLLSLAPAP